ncbi:hypothetical protein HOLleu_34372 [Holothuria leucospilota]|uniref:Uncharacterized protein n=1 Tax=Holothuria leucospilota TaxID=206669 RepID=A0A9Q0YLB0_HOLLE|nr:hypothetical protein HOLleu_34372 [Holothuria leucospilota]
MDTTHLCLFIAYIGSNFSYNRKNLTFLLQDCQDALKVYSMPVPSYPVSLDTTASSRISPDERKNFTTMFIS